MIENLTGEHKEVAERTTRFIQECIARPLGIVAGAAESIFTPDSKDSDNSDLENNTLVPSR